MKKITDPSFKYVPSYSTNVGKRFKRVQAEQKAAAERAKAEAEAAAKEVVQHFPRRKPA